MPLNDALNMVGARVREPIDSTNAMETTLDAWSERGDPTRLRSAVACQSEVDAQI
jgi:hypothetical protein